LAGDACHTHSSGAAQGMNTGVHDAYNLAWKLAGTIKGWYEKEVLETYDSERRSTAKHLTEVDKTFSTLISGQIPGKYQATYTDANELFSKLFEETADFNLGLGIQYEENILNKAPSAGMISAGSRAPDALVYPPGSHFPVRLFTLGKYMGRWTIMLFAGQYELTQEKLHAAAKGLIDLAQTLPQGVTRLMTIFASSMATVPSIIPKAGFMYYDQDRSAHLAYSISPKTGALVVLRPDGMLGYATTLDDFGSVAEFLTSFVKAQRR
jgi:phenol 2-monooxygenase